MGGGRESHPEPFRLSLLAEVYIQKDNTAPLPPARPTPRPTLPSARFALRHARAAPWHPVWRRAGGAAQKKENRKGSGGRVRHPLPPTLAASGERGLHVPTTRACWPRGGWHLVGPLGPVGPPVAGNATLGPVTPSLLPHRTWVAGTEAREARGRRPGPPRRHLVPHARTLRTPARGCPPSRSMDAGHALQGRPRPRCAAPSPWRSGALG
eukprot:scaffold7378_cov410-Prasinococcus_capsulatus_cf.AAC.1